MSTLATDLLRLGVRVKDKRGSLLMRFLALFLGSRFMTSAWTTMGRRTIWAPTGADLTINGLLRRETIIRHELIHIAQARRWPVWFQLSYLLLPLPVGFAYFRWRFEREAYLVNLRAGQTSIDAVVDSLWGFYAWTWPKPWMRRWFAKELRR